MGDDVLCLAPEGIPAAQAPGDGVLAEGASDEVITGGREEFMRRAPLKLMELDVELGVDGEVPLAPAAFRRVEISVEGL